MINKVNPDIIDAIKNDSLVFFVGAGFSLDYGYPLWSDLVKTMLKKLQAYNESYSDYIPLLNHKHIDVLSILDFIKGEESRVRDYIEQEFQFNETKSDKLRKHKKLFEITKKVITTNYDRLLEEAAGKEIPSVVYTNKNKMSNLSDMNSYIFKIHGDFEDSANCVLFREDYERLYSNDQAAIQELKNIVTSKCILFVGFSLTDPYFREVLKKLKSMYHNLKKPNYILTTSADDFTEFGVQPFYFDNHSQIEEYLDQLIEEKAKNNHNIFDNIENRKEVEILNNSLKLWKEFNIFPDVDLLVLLNEIIPSKVMPIQQLILLYFSSFLKHAELIEINDKISNELMFNDIKDHVNTKKSIFSEFNLIEGSYLEKGTKYVISQVTIKYQSNIEKGIYLLCTDKEEQEGIEMILIKHDYTYRVRHITESAKNFYTEISDMLYSIPYQD
ncbi:SIR2 family protein [Paenibacillus illinoisensis]|uniref:SIR2 family protein n=1 Tax=Paenibacillus illinoisensis TaxID=59845 RepID=UPI003018B2F1